MPNKRFYSKQQGAVSLFVVVFTALLITVVTVSFVRIMIHDQQQATVTDLSQSAYDSAQAGVEDAKRALLRYQNAINDGAIVDTGDWAADCNNALNGLEGLDASGNEIKIKTNGDNALDQAYTCVKVLLNTSDYLGRLSLNGYKIIPLSGTGSFDTVKLQWFSSNDISLANNSAVSLQADNNKPLLATDRWAANKPPIMRAQLVQFSKDNGFKLSDFDNTAASGQSNANTLFLYPSAVGSNNVNFALNDVRRTVNIPVNNPVKPGSPVQIKCSNSLAVDLYACSAEIRLPSPINGGARTAYLLLQSLYNKASYKLELLDSTKGNAVVSFKAVQPQIDSTGRTNDLFRRVLTRVELTDINFPYPQAEIYVAGNLCKDFRITDNTTDYVSNCAP